MREKFPSPRGRRQHQTEASLARSFRRTPARRRTRRPAMQSNIDTLIDQMRAHDVLVRGTRNSARAHR